MRIYDYNYEEMFLFTYRVPVFTLSTTKCFKKRNGVLQVAVL
jgi:hypothetical protein